MGKPSSASLSFAAAAVLLSLTATNAYADSSITEIKVSGQLSQEGILSVTQEISGEQLGSMISQRLEKQAADGELSTLNYEISDITVTAAEQPIKYDSVEDADSITVSFDPSTANGAPVVLSYSVKGTTKPNETVSKVTEFSWPIIQGFNLPVEKATGQLTFRVPPPDFDCQAGNPDALRNCSLWSIDRHALEAITFEDGPISPGEVIEVSGSQPADSLASTAVITQRWTLDRAFSFTLGSTLTALEILLLGGIALWAWHRKLGRDESSAEPTVVAEFHPVGDGLSEFRLTAQIRPGQIGTVADESVDPIDITATIIDLAVRGYLTFEQINTSGGTDWRILPTGKETDELLSYERNLLSAVAPKEGLLVSEIQGAVSEVLYDVQHCLYDDVVSQGWFTKHPGKARADSRAIGAGIIVLGLLTTMLLAWFTTWGLVGLAVIGVGVATLFVAGEMPRRSAAGASLLSGLTGLSAILAQQRTDVFAEGSEINEISKVLPYAIVLGSKERWIQAMVDSDKTESPDPEAISWYRAPKTWHLQQLPHSLDSLIASLQGHLFGR